MQGTPTRSSPKEEASEVEGGSDGWGVAARKGENEEEKGVNAKTEREAVVIDQKPHEGSRPIIFADKGYPRGAGGEAIGTTASGLRPWKIIPSQANY